MNKYGELALEAIGRIKAILEMDHITDKDKIKRISEKVLNTGLFEIKPDAYALLFDEHIPVKIIKESNGVTEVKPLKRITIK